MRGRTTISLEQHRRPVGAKPMVCTTCGMRVVANIAQAKMHGWELWVGGARCKRCRNPTSGEPTVCMVSTCVADSDGECSYIGCPQLNDGEPKRSGRHCPLDRSHDDG
jgi:hypothetical protein